MQITTQTATASISEWRKDLASQSATAAVFFFFLFFFFFRNGRRSISYETRAFINCFVFTHDTVYLPQLPTIDRRHTTALTFRTKPNRGKGCHHRWQF